LLTEGKNALFHDIIEPVTVSYLIKEGYLCELKSKSTSIKLDTTGVHKRGGDFIESELQSAVNNDLTNEGVVEEIIRRGVGRKAGVVFATGILHAEELNRLFLERGEKSAIVTGKTPKKERTRILDDFKSGVIERVVNCKVLTTGFNHKGIDLIADVQPTLSPGLYAQKAGRGLRIHPDKTDCLILDFAGNIATHGPITNVTPPNPKGVKEGEAPVKTCPECDEIIHISVMTCPSCGYEFPIEEKTFKLSNEDIMGRDMLKEMTLTAWDWSIHTSRNSGKELLKVRYYGQLSDPIVEEYLCVGYEGFAGNKARRTLVDIGIKSGADTSVKTLEDTVLSMQAATPPSALHYQKDGKFFTVMDRIWE
jgi:DNA repair protein RadD